MTAKRKKSATGKKQQNLWKKLGFAGGLEIHQQLDTEKKLFCRCPVGYLNTTADARILRHMRPTLSEMGEYDGTALMEFKTKKRVIYELYSDATCSYEMDDTPPFPLNQQALDIAIEISLLLNCAIVDEVHVTRKQYLDGSIPTGFQRTLIVGVGGWIPFKGRKLRITQVNLEEDACREMSDIGHTITFRTDRLSTPLVEVITDKQLYSPQEMQDANRELARVLRASGKIRRGIGSVRQDVNVSVKGGDRCEIKGVERYQYIEALTRNEALRQKHLLDLRQVLREIGVTERSLRVEQKIFTGDQLQLKTPLLSAALKQGQVVGAIKLCGLAGILAKTLQPGRSFANEIADRIRVIACIDTLPHFFHSDDPKSGVLLQQDWKKIKKLLTAKSSDLVAGTFGFAEDVQTALNEIQIRILEASKSVPRETRQDLGQGITGFERILPGPDRMYPDTDSEPVCIKPARVDNIRRQLAVTPWAREKQGLKLGLSAESARQLADSDFYLVFAQLIKANARLAKPLSRMLIQQFPWLVRHGVDPLSITKQNLKTLTKAAAELQLDNAELQKILLELALADSAKQAALLKRFLNRPALNGHSLRQHIKLTLKQLTARQQCSKANLARASMRQILLGNGQRIDPRQALKIAREEARKLSV